MTYFPNEGVTISDKYPNDVLLDPTRSIQILVKKNESIAGGVEQLKTYIEKVQSDLEKAADSVSNNDQAADEKRQKALRSRSAKLTGNNVKTMYGLALPLPNELSDSQSHQWETTEGVVGGVLGSMYNTEIAGGVSISKVIGNMSSEAGMRKPLVNPGYFQDYKGSEPREFSFSWDLIPRNATEATAIMNILYNLKKYTLPTATIGGIGMMSPFLFDIIIGNDAINNIMNMNNVVCKSMTINYSADGSLQFLPDGIPKYIKLDMTFAERTLVTSEFY